MWASIWEAESRTVGAHLDSMDGVGARPWAVGEAVSRIMSRVYAPSFFELDSYLGRKNRWLALCEKAVEDPKLRRTRSVLRC
jgi:hypothetical protein